MSTSEYKQSSARGLYLPMHARLKGRVRWQVLDERGIPEVPRTPSGVPVGPVEGVDQDNLITNLGMDQIAAYNSLNAAPNTTSTWRRYLAVGTGSSTPDATDTTLDNEAQRAANSGSFPAGAATGSLDTNANEWIAEATATRVVTMNTDRNITEFGFSPVASANIGIRELLRDGSGNPITVSLLDGKTLRLDHTLNVAIPAPPTGHTSSIDIEEYDAGNNLINTVAVDIIYGLWQSAGSVIGLDATGVLLIAALMSTWEPSNTATNGSYHSRRLINPVAYDRTAAIASGDQEPSSGVTSFGAPEPQPYVPGSHQRIFRRVVSTGQGNGPWTGFILPKRSGTSGTLTPNGLLVVFDDPVSYTKQSTDTLRVGFISSWARA